MARSKGKATVRVERDVADPQEASKVQIVTAVLAIIGGDTRFVVLDELAIACHRLVPQGFGWQEYNWLPNVDLVRVSGLVDAGRSGLVEMEKETHGKSLGAYRLTSRGKEWIGRNGVFLDFLRRRLPDRESYIHLDKRDLVAVAVLSATRADHVNELPRERVVAESYRLFPEAFAMKIYKGWPDSSTVERALRECPGVSTTDTTCSLRPADLDRVETLYRKIHIEESRGFGTTERKGIKGTARKMVERVTRTKLYHDWRESRDHASIRSEDVCEVLWVTLDAEPSTVRKHLESTLRLVEQAERQDLVQFMRWVARWCEGQGYRF